MEQASYEQRAGSAILTVRLTLFLIPTQRARWT
jgi:hypothetical protein